MEKIGPIDGSARGTAEGEKGTTRPLVSRAEPPSIQSTVMQDVRDQGSAVCDGEARSEYRVWRLEMHMFDGTNPDGFSRLNITSPRIRWWIRW
ncbi:hypothetical protein L484_014716 [Morus notabilis]|uniref:Uncharacterized protein n=1 Tax=Morus notabilis TaxID=981085 RepID=W9R065_9ROSA|nr:hypothetical protein L484_014716 [Morus notabilis]